MFAPKQQHLKSVAQLVRKLSVDLGDSEMDFPFDFLHPLRPLAVLRKLSFSTTLVLKLSFKRVSSSSSLSNRRTESDEERDSN
jgi:hypothetical protein